MLLYNLIYDLISDLIYNKPNVTEIIPGLWLGNHQSAIDIDFLKKNNINFILNCTPNTPFFNEIHSKKSLINWYLTDSLKKTLNTLLKIVITLTS